MHNLRKNKNKAEGGNLRGQVDGATTFHLLAYTRGWQLARPRLTAFSLCRIIPLLLPFRSDALSLRNDPGPSSPVDPDPDPRRVAFVPEWRRRLGRNKAVSHTVLASPNSQSTDFYLCQYKFIQMDKIRT